MAPKPGENEGFRVLEDFVCDAIPGPGISTDGPCARGENEGVDVQWELVVNASPDPLTQDRKAELRRLNTTELHALVQKSWSELSPAELGFIHEIALEGLAQKEGNLTSNGAEELSREVMQAALRRIA
jgi:hypothetical protein